MYERKEAHCLKSEGPPEAARARTCVLGFRVPCRNLELYCLSKGDSTLPSPWQFSSSATLLERSCSDSWFGLTWPRVPDSATRPPQKALSSLASVLTCGRGQSVFTRNADSQMGETENLVVFICRCFIYLGSMRKPQVSAPPPLRMRFALRVRPCGGRGVSC